MKSTSLLAAAMLLSFLIACKENVKLKTDAITLSAIQEEPLTDDKASYFATDSTAAPDQTQKKINGTKSVNPSPDWDKKIIKVKTENKTPKGYSFIGWNLKHPILKDKEVRKALSMLLGGI